MAPWRRVLGSAVGAVDRAVVVAMQMRGARDRARADKMGHEERVEALTAIHRDYGGDEIIADMSRFFPTPPAIDPVLRSVRRGSPPRTEVWDAHWPSTFEPYLAEVAPKVLAHVENRTARARLFLADAHAPSASSKKRPALCSPQDPPNAP